MCFLMKHKSAPSRITLPNVTVLVDRSTINDTIQDIFDIIFTNNTAIQVSTALLLLSCYWCYCDGARTIIFLSPHSLYPLSIHTLTCPISQNTLIYTP